MAQNNLSPISEFDPYGPNAKNRWNAYKEQLDTYFDASEIPDNMKRSTLLEMGGTKIRSIVSVLKEPGDTYAETIHQLDLFFESLKSQPCEEHRFSMIRQEKEETIDKFVTRLRENIVRCNYSAEIHDYIIADRIIAGVYDKRLQSRLLKVQKVLLENTLKICRNYESAPRKMCDFDDLTESVNLNASTSHDKPRKSKKHRKQILCDRCGADDHYAHRCPKKLNAKCKYCGKDGHLEQVCWEKKKEKYRSQEGWPRRGYRLSLNRIIAGDYSTGENKEPPSSETPETTSKEIKP